MTDRHPATTGLLRWFEYSHLPAHLQAVSKPIGDVAHQLVDVLPDGPELSAGLRKLLEAKDCLVRAAIDAPNPGPAATKPCSRCDGCGLIADSDDGEPWTVWEQLPPGSAGMAVRLGLVKPIDCPACGGAKVVPTIP